MDTATEQEPGTTAHLTLAERFEKFHGENPGIYRALVGYCREYARATDGKRRRSRFGIRPPYERLRWDLAVRTIRAVGEPKLDNGYAAFYARLIAHQEPDLAGVFETRRAPEADEWASQLPHPRD